MEHDDHDINVLSRMFSSTSVNPDVKKKSKLY